MATFNIRGTEVLVNEEDLSLVAAHCWWFTPQGYPCTKIRQADGSRKTLGMHRLILGDPDSEAIDHINRNKLDNRRENLRACSDSVNNRNTPTRKNKASKHRGVSKYRDGRWQVVLRIEGKLKWCGVFDTEDEAARVAAPHFAGIAI